jgi:hypothetical protein
VSGWTGWRCPEAGGRQDAGSRRQFAEVFAEAVGAGPVRDMAPPLSGGGLLRRLAGRGGHADWLKAMRPFPPW